MQTVLVKVSREFNIRVKGSQGLLPFVVVLFASLGDQWAIAGAGCGEWLLAAVSLQPGQGTENTQSKPVGSGGKGSRPKFLSRLLKWWLIVG